MVELVTRSVQKDTVDPAAPFASKDFTAKAICALSVHLDGRWPWWLACFLPRCFRSHWLETTSPTSTLRYQNGLRR